MAPLSSITAESCVRAFLVSWVARFGLPSVLTSDCGTQFTKVCRSLGISPSTTTSYHHQGNGMIDRFHISLKAALHACLAGSEWFLYLSLVLLGLQSVHKENMSFSISKTVFGSPLTVPGEFLEGGEILPSRFLQKIEHAVSIFTIPPPHHVPPAEPAFLPPVLLAARFVFV